MEMFTSMNSILYLLNVLMDNNNSDIKWNYLAQKPDFTEKKQIKPLERITPEEVGISSVHIMSFFKELTNFDKLNAHSIMLCKNGKVFAEGDFKPYRKEIWHVTHSMCKSIVSIAIGMLIDDGKLNLNDTAFEILKKGNNQLNATFFSKKITIENLLTMCSGVEYREPAALIEKDWLKGFFKTISFSKAGNEFSYNSMNSFVLACIVKEVSGENIMEFLKPRLFEPLGITNVAWEKNANNLEKGGWGMYITLEDITKIGILLSQNGIWVVDGEEKQILSSKYINLATKTHVSEKNDVNNIEYGYQIWTREKDGVFHFNGMFGQYVVCIPKQNMVISYNSGAYSLSNKSHMLDCVDKYFANINKLSDNILPNFKANYQLTKGLSRLEYKKEFQIEKVKLIDILSNKFKKYNMLKAKSLNYKKNRLLPKILKSVNNNEYIFNENYIGLLPVVVQCTNANLGSGLKAISFNIKNDELILNWMENDVDKIELPLVEGISREYTINYHNEKFVCSNITQFKVNKDEILVFEINICFLESSCSRKIRLSFNGDKVIVSLDEEPNVTDILDHLPIAKTWMREIISLKDNNYTKNILDKLTEPRIIGKKNNRG